MNVKSTRKRILLSCLAAAQATIGCAEVNDAEFADESAPRDFDVEGVSSGIINGTASSSAEMLGMVSIRHQDAKGNALCSGTLVRNDLILTAAHCATTSGDIGGTLDTNYANYELKLGAQTGRVVHAVASNAFDMALLQTDQFFSVNNTRYDITRNIFSSPTVVSGSLTCFGYGRYTPTGESNTFRMASFSNFLASPYTIAVFPNASGQMLWHGDSGGSCLAYDGRVAGVISSFTNTSTPENNIPELATLVGYETVRPFVLEQRLASAEAYRHIASAPAGASSTITHADADGKSGALLQVTPNLLAGPNNNTFIGVRWDGSKWAVRNLNGAAMTAQSGYNYSVGGNSFLHTTAGANIAGNRTTLNSPLLNGQPNALVFVTQDATGTANPRAVGVRYDSIAQRWSVFNEDNAAMPVNARFHIRVARSGEPAFVHKAEPLNVLFNWTYLDHPLLNNQPAAKIFVTHNISAPGGGGATMTSPLAVNYDTFLGKWVIVTQDLGNMHWSSTYNVLIRP